MKLYYSKGACSLASRIIINELGLTCEYEAVDLKTKKTQTGANYFQVNAKGAVPALEIKPGEVLTENAVIQQYLADSQQAFNLLPQVGDFKRYRVLEWLNYITTELHKGFSPLFNPNFPEELKEKMTIPMLKNKFAYINQHLEKQAYLAGDHFTLPDAYFFVMIIWAYKMKFDVKQWLGVTTYFNELLKRKAFEKSIQEEDLHLRPIE